ncbi:hypothetical protein KUL156_32380 [Alteromonas sp. KUL156]|nr:hypothetical protein KUL154_54480 [Alteromonas sp. KUL154]GFE00646.1 hypothetical protein KUL156_32380 [Alteromonas sp. KUL156]
MNNFPFKLLVLCCALVFFSCSSNENELIDSTSDSTVSIEEKSIENEILDLINDYRLSKGLSTLKKLEAIKSQTYNHTMYMIKKKELSHDFFHDRKDYLVENTNAIKVAENVAYGYSTAESVVNGWIKSEGHRKNIEGDFTHFEVTAEKNTGGTWYYTNIFVKK